jgi:hypothetical protein
MDFEINTTGDSPKKQHHRSKTRSATYAIVIFAMGYVSLSYLAVPYLWHRYSVDHPQFDDSPRITSTGFGHPGDPLNIAVIGTIEQLKVAMLAANWLSADALGLRSDILIATDTVFDRSYNDAPVSSLYLFGRKQDLAFEQGIGHSPSRRHHVRFWQTTSNDSVGRPIWIGSASFDQSVGFSHTTGQITHHISSDVDQEREHVMETLSETKHVSEIYRVPEFHTIKQGRNGGGDLWKTDGELGVVILAIE